MRIRNYFFLVTSLLMVGFIGFVNTKKTSIDTINYSVKPESTAINNDLDTKNAVALSTTSLSIATNTSELVVGDTKKVQEVFKLKVPYFSQQYANSCEASSLRMALAYYHIEILDDMDIVQRFGYNPRKKDTVLNEWDNPQEMFVGNIDIVGSTEGYGVYGKPVEKAAVSYGREAVYITKITAQLLAKELKAGHPIILWGYTSITAPAYTWNLKDGGEVTAFKGEHARLVVGFTGKVDTPTGFYVHDPFNGNASEYWNTEKLMNQVSAVPGVTNQAVVIK